MSGKNVEDASYSDIHKTKKQEEKKKMNQYSFRHSGVRGMKWGQRLYQYKDGSLTPLGRIHYSKSSKSKSSKSKSSKSKSSKSKSSKSKSLKNLSDEELKAKTQRLINENNYYKAQSEWEKYTNPTSPVRKLVGEILTASAKNIGTQATTYAMGTVLNNLAGKEIVDPYKGGLSGKNKKNKKDD